MSKVRQRSVSGASLDWRIRKTFFSLKGCVNVVYNKVLIQPAEQAACSLRPSLVLTVGRAK